MHIHGTDGVHAKLEGDSLCLYWCESKLYASPTAAVRSCFESIAPLLLDPGGGASAQDLLLVRDNLDTADPVVDTLLRRFFDDDDAMSAKREIRGACLVGFNLDDYPNPGVDGSGLAEDIVARIDDWFGHVRDSITGHGLESFNIEVFCVPFPSVSDLRRAFAKRLALSEN